MRYEDGFLIQCLLLKMKSSQAYVHLRNRRVLPLPHPSTIHRLLSSSQIKFWFNDLALESIKKELEESNIYERWGSLIWDEMTLKKDRKWDQSKLEWRGIVDFGDIKTKTKEGIADPALVLSRPVTKPSGGLQMTTGNDKNQSDNFRKFL